VRTLKAAYVLKSQAEKTFKERNIFETPQLIFYHDKREF